MIAVALIVISVIIAGFLVMYSKKSGSSVSSFFGGKKAAGEKMDDLEKGTGPDEVAELIDDIMDIQEEGDD